METTDFIPPRRNGILFQSALILALLSSGGIFFFQAIETSAGSMFLVDLVLAVLLFIPIPILVYRLYSLIGGHYTVERDGLRLRWGLRSEDVSIIDIDWIYPAREYHTLLSLPVMRAPRLPLPWLRWPGAIRGSRSTSSLGTIEYLAADTAHLLLVGTAKRIYGVSPADPEAFMRAFHRATEMGSLSPLPSRSVYPVVVVERLWTNRAARALVAAGFALNLILLVWVVLTIPNRASITLGFAPSGAALEASPAERLLLLPVLGAFAFVVDLLFGIYFYRKDESKPVAYILWGASILTGILLLAGVAYILSSHPV